MLDDVADVRRVRPRGYVFVLDRQARAELDAGLDAGEKKTGTQRAAAGEGVEKSDAGVALGEVGTIRRPEDCLVGGATETAQLPAPSMPARAKARDPRAVPTVVRSPDGFADPGSARPVVLPSSEPSFSARALGSSV